MLPFPSSLVTSAARGTQSFSCLAKAVQFDSKGITAHGEILLLMGCGYTPAHKLIHEGQHAMFIYLYSRYTVYIYILLLFVVVMYGPFELESLR